MRLAAVGSNCIDYYNNIDGGKAFPGGGPVNMAVYTLRLGGEAAYIGPVGDDVYGQIMIETIKAKGVDTSHLRVEKGKTAVTQVELIDGERVFGDYDEGVLEKYKLTDEDKKEIERIEKCFHEAINDDMNMPLAMSYVWELIKYNKKSPEIAELLIKIDSVLGIKIDKEEKLEIPQDVLELIEKRTQARKERNWEESDRLRDKIFEKGYIVKDSKDSVEITKK